VSKAEQREGECPASTVVVPHDRSRGQEAHHVAASSHDPDGTGKGRKMPRNRARTLILLALLAIIIVVFGYMLLVSQVGQ
jgi:hypothetical protein